MAYLAYVLTSASRAKLLDYMQGKYPEVVAHHVTAKFPVPTTYICEETSHEISVIGFAYNDKIEAAIVLVDGEEFREDGKRFHITISLDRSKGAKPFDSNKMIEENMIYKFITPIDLIGIKSVES